jgi:splicing factor 3B subunit 3
MTRGSVYILNRDQAANLTISSPLEAHKAHAIIHSIVRTQPLVSRVCRFSAQVGVDVGFENPLFAALEVDYGDSDQDPSGEAFNAAEKVLSLLSLAYIINRG